jgi:hypothetical protein
MIWKGRAQQIQKDFAESTMPSVEKGLEATLTS